MIQKFKSFYAKHSIIYTIILIPIVLFGIYILYLFAFFGYIRYIDMHAYDAKNEEIAKIVPFSQRGLPVPATDVPVTLPPDPGEAGKKTLAGIDSNNDGVRDDLEREIVYMYPQNEEVRRVLRAMVKARQQRMITEGDHEYYKMLSENYSNYENCYLFLVFGPIGPDDNTNRDILVSMLTNTDQRNKKDTAHFKMATPFIVRVAPTSCDPVKGQY